MHRSPWPRSSGPSERLIAPPPPPTAALKTYDGGVSARRGDGGPYLPPAQAGSLFLHSSVACMRASVYSRISFRFFCSSGVIGGTLAVRRIDDHRGPPAGAQVRREHGGVVGAADILLGPSLATPLARFTADDVRDLFVDRGALFVGELRFVRVFGGPLQRFVGVASPDALEVWWRPTASSEPGPPSRVRLDRFGRSAASGPLSEAVRRP